MSDSPNTQEEAQPLFGKDEDAAPEPGSDADRARRKIDNDPALSPAGAQGGAALADTGRRKD